MSAIFGIPIAVGTASIRAFINKRHEKHGSVILRRLGTIMARTDDRDARVGDYLDDKLQTLADLDSLDALLESVRNQHTLLRKQV